MLPTCLEERLLQLGGGRGLLYGRGEGGQGLLLHLGQAIRGVAGGQGGTAGRTMSRTRLNVDCVKGLIRVSILGKLRETCLQGGKNMSASMRGARRDPFY